MLPVYQDPLSWTNHTLRQVTILSGWIPTRPITIQKDWKTTTENLKETGKESRKNTEFTQLKYSYMKHKNFDIILRQTSAPFWKSQKGSCLELLLLYFSPPLISRKNSYEGQNVQKKFEAQNEHPSVKLFGVVFLFSPTTYFIHFYVSHGAVQCCFDKLTAELEDSTQLVHISFFVLWHFTTLETS